MRMKSTLICSVWLVTNCLGHRRRKFLHSGWLSLKSNVILFSLANHEKSKKHKENLAALKLVLQEEEDSKPQPLSDGTGSDSELDLIVDNDGRENDISADSDSNVHSEKNSGTHNVRGGDRCDDINRHSDQQKDRDSNEEESRQEANVMEQFSSNDTCKVVENDITLNRGENRSSDEGVGNDEDFGNEEDLLFLTQKKRQKESSQPLDDLEDLISVTADKSEEHSSQHQRY